MTAVCPACVDLPVDRIVANANARGPELQLSLPGIHCAGCISGVERALSAVSGVTSIRVNLTLKRASVTPVRPDIISATLGPATHMHSDTTPAFTWSGTELVAPADLAPGNRNPRLDARPANGTPFRRRIVLHVEAPA